MAHSCYETYHTFTERKATYAWIKIRVTLPSVLHATTIWAAME